MEPSFWRTSWQEGRIGFHQGRPNALLEKHVSVLDPPSSKVFVPLCGKTEDMAFLAARGHDVVGIDLVDTALRAFFAEHSLTPSETKDDRLVTFQSGPFTLHAADFFALTAADLAGATCAYDRAAIVALPPDMRVRYAAHLQALLPKGAAILTVTFDYDATRFEGPPFAVDEAELRRVYGPAATIDPLDALPITGEGSLAKASAGATEKCFVVRL